MTIKIVMDLYNYNDSIDSLYQSPLLFGNLLNGSENNYI